MERRLVPVNAILDLSLADGLNPAPLAAAGWQVKALEVPVRTTVGTWVCDVVLFNDATGHLLGAEAKSGANIEPDQARKVAGVDPAILIEAGGITVPRDVPLPYEPLYACLEEHAERIALVVCKGACFSLRALDLAEDLVGVLGPGERVRVVVPVIDEGADGVGELAD